MLVKSGPCWGQNFSNWRLAVLEPFWKYKNISMACIVQSCLHIERKKTLIPQFHHHVIQSLKPQEESKCLVVMKKSVNCNIKTNVCTTDWTWWCQWAGLQYNINAITRETPNTWVTFRAPTTLKCLQSIKNKCDGKNHITSESIWY